MKIREPVSLLSLSLVGGPFQFQLVSNWCDLLSFIFWLCDTFPETLLKYGYLPVFIDFLMHEQCVEGVYFAFNLIF